MANPNIPTTPTNLEIGVLDSGESPVPSHAPISHPPIDERVQKQIDKFLYGGGRESAQKIRNFLNGTWLGEPLHVVLTDVPIGAWSVAIAFDLLDMIRARREFALAADSSIAIGLIAAAGTAVTGMTDWSDVDPPARRTGFIHAAQSKRNCALYNLTGTAQEEKEEVAHGWPHLRRAGLCRYVICGPFRWRDGLQAQGRRRSHTGASLPNRVCGRSS